MYKKFKKIFKTLSAYNKKKTFINMCLGFDKQKITMRSKGVFS